MFIVNNMLKTTKNSKSILEQQRFIVVADSIDKDQYNHNFEIGIDLKIKNYYNSTQAAVKNGKNLENIHTFLHLIVITVFFMRKLPPQF